jgi:hypothetical protein
MALTAHEEVCAWLKKMREIPPEGRVFKRKQEPHLRLVASIDNYLQLLYKGEVDADTSILVEKCEIADEEYYIDSAGWVYDQISKKVIGKWNQDDQEWEDEDDYQDDYQDDDQESQDRWMDYDFEEQESVS